VGVLIVVGYAVSRRTWGRRLLDTVNLYLFFIAIPLATFIKVATITSEVVFLLLTFFSTIHIFLIYTATYVYAKLLNVDAVPAVSLSSSLSPPNSLFLAIPLSLVLPYGIYCLHSSCTDFHSYAN